jgi:hypothetical protein
MGKRTLRRCAYGKRGCEPIQTTPNLLGRSRIAMADKALCFGRNADFSQVAGGLNSASRGVVAGIRPGETLYPLATLSESATSVGRRQPTQD